MRKVKILALMGTAVIIGTLLSQPGEPPPAKQFMRQKLEHAQRVLEGITVEDFDLIAKSARKLSGMSQDAGWRAFDNREYSEHSGHFRRNVDALAKAAANRNLDGAMLAYFNMTMSCVECHKFIRGKKAAQIKGSHAAISMLNLPHANDTLGPK